jgi:hypothetical protein
MAEAHSGRGAHNEFHGSASNVVQAGSIKHLNLYQSGATKRLGVDLVAVRPTVERVSDLSALASSWVEERRAALTALADDYDWSRNRQEASPLAQQEGLRQGKFPDPRSRTVYESYVREFLSQADQVL